MPPKDEKKKKDGRKSAIKDKDPINKSGGKAKKKWSKGKVQDKLNNLILFDKATYDKLCKEVPNYKRITPAVVSGRLKIQGSLARAVPQELRSKDSSSWFQSTEPKEFTPETQRVEVPQLLVKMHRQIQSAVHLGK